MWLVPSGGLLTDSEKTREFSPEELPLYVTMLADTYLPAFPENTRIPLLILYDGMRNNEIAQFIH